jgi:hypothetical protein
LKIFELPFGVVVRGFKSWYIAIPALVVAGLVLKVLSSWPLITNGVVALECACCGWGLTPRKYLGVWDFIFCSLHKKNERQSKHQKSNGQCKILVGLRISTVTD